MNKNIYHDFNKLNIEYFEKVKKSLHDPLGINISNDVNWIKLNKKWNSSDFPVVIGGTGQPILFYMDLIVVSSNSGEYIHF